MNIPERDNMGSVLPLRPGDAAPLKFAKSETKTLRELNLDERWLHDRIVEDPSILGLGDVTVIERERSQPTGGRLDLLLRDPEEDIRYEVEIMLGRLDESHIIRSIEYWDVERTRFPQLEHRAVIVAEDITNRFFNVISLLNRAVPIIAIQMSALQVQDKFILAFLKVLDVAELFADDDDESGAQVDRGYWEKRSNPTSMVVVDKIITLVAPARGVPRVTYNKHHIAIGTSARNFMWLHPRKNASHCHIELLLDGEERTVWAKRLDDVGIVAGSRGKSMTIRLSQKELLDNEPLVRELLLKVESLSRD